jgi:NAD+ kinase
MSLDNRSFILPAGEKVLISKAEFDIKYISLTRDSFIEALKEKLLWGKDKRNS